MRLGGRGSLFFLTYINIFIVCQAAILIENVIELLIEFFLLLKIFIISTPMHFQGDVFYYNSRLMCGDAEADLSFRNLA